ncbi:MAG: hypothetical protein HFI38_02060 [Lachnospiraceae bacterium]|jgi:hypothetical protein|nr:hypothetical protein [Lachnospiraceae bacterium]
MKEEKPRSDEHSGQSVRPLGRHLAGSLAFLGILAVLLLLLSRLFLPKNNRQDFGMGEMKANGILAEEANTIEVVALGNSECATAIAPMVMWREQGITAYNCGTAGQYLYQTVMYLEQALAGQSPSVVILEADTIYKECMLSDYLFSKLEAILPVLRYHDRWKSLRAEDLGPVEYTWSDPNKGCMFYLDTVPVCPWDYMAPSDDVRQAARWNRQCLKEIIALCEEKGARLLLVSTPSLVNWNAVNHNGIAALAEEFGLEYLDLNMLCEELGIDWQTDTKDGGDHMNAWGAEKVSSYLAAYLTERYQVGGHGGQTGFESWEEALAEYERQWEEQTGDRDQG